MKGGGGHQPAMQPPCIPYIMALTA